MNPFEEDWADVLPDHGKQTEDLRRVSLTTWIGGISERREPPILMVPDQSVARERLITSALASAPVGTLMTRIVLDATWTKDAAASAFVNAISWMSPPGSRETSAWAWLDRVMSMPRSVIRNPLQSVLNGQKLEGSVCTAIQLVLEAQSAFREHDQVAYGHFKKTLSAWLSGTPPGTSYKQFTGSGRLASRPATVRSRLNALCALLAFAVDQGVFRHPLIILDEPPRGHAVEAVSRTVPALKTILAWQTLLEMTPIGVILGVKASHVRSILLIPGLWGQVTALPAN